MVDSVFLLCLWRLEHQIPKRHEGVEIYQISLFGGASNLVFAP